MKFKYTRNRTHFHNPHPLKYDKIDLCAWFGAQTDKKRKQNLKKSRENAKKRTRIILTDLYLLRCRWQMANSIYRQSRKKKHIQINGSTIKPKQVMQNSVASQHPQSHTLAIKLINIILFNNENDTSSDSWSTQVQQPT